jgi:hypothetical protein
MMFADTKIIILDDRFRVLERIKADVQGFSSTISFDFGVQLEISKRVFCKPYPFLKASLYFRIGEQLYKPFIHKEWDSYFEIYLYKMRRDNMETIDELMDFFLLDRGEVITIDNVETAGVILDASETIGEYQDKVIFCKQELKRGDLIIYKGEPYLLFFPAEQKKHSYVGRARKCNHKIAFNFQGDVQWFDAIIQAKTFDTDSGKFITLPAGKVEVWLPENEVSIRIQLQQRFLNTNRAWKVAGIDRTQNGLMRLFCELTEMSSEDNFELGIANYNKYFHQYTISFSNPQPIKMTEGNTTQLDTVVKDNGSTVTPIPPITYTTLDETIATVNEKGEVTAIGEGTVMVTAKLTNNSEATASIEIQVAKATPEPTGYSITLFYGKSPTIRIGGFGTTITATVSANGETISDKPVDWSARNEDGSETPKVQFLDVTDTSCRMQGLDDMDSVGTFVIVKATLREDSTIFAEQSFQLRSLF